MSIALESSSNGIERSGFIGGISSRISVFESPESGREFPTAVQNDRRFPAQAANQRPTEEEALTSCSSSIGKNSDLSGRSQSDDGDDEAEVQSSYKGPLSTMDALEDSLPVRQGISRFYCGKSKSFTTLADAASIAAKDLAKPESLYNRKRKNLLAFSNFYDRNQLSHLGHSWEGISKRPANSSRSTLALSMAVSSSESNTSEESEFSGLPPLHPQAKASLNISSRPRQRSLSSRSFSLTDLHNASTGSTIAPS
ncbi:protein OXIDATIVE STRESS 3 LIKE 1-like [Aristolochia californica]|uniref:protein OXIDATIVE STRESS 3 LIKE 1-like n=1 Tax=Aristolochia californica TaxID=171875 RepID=UPI0035DD24BC